MTTKTADSPFQRHGDSPPAWGCFSWLVPSAQDCRSCSASSAGRVGTVCVCGGCGWMDVCVWVDGCVCVGGRMDVYMWVGRWVNACAYVQMQLCALYYSLEECNCVCVCVCVCVFVWPTYLHKLSHELWVLCHCHGVSPCPAHHLTHQLRVTLHLLHHL